MLDIQVTFKDNKTEDLWRGNTIQVHYNVRNYSQLYLQTGASSIVMDLTVLVVPLFQLLLSVNEQPHLKMNSSSADNALAIVIRLVVMFQATFQA